MSLDEDPFGELEAGGDAVSSEVNDAVRLEFERRHRHLAQMLDELDAEHGAGDEGLVARFIGLLD